MAFSILLPPALVARRNAAADEHEHELNSAHRGRQRTLGRACTGSHGG